jgi:hypothetical protein
MYLLLQSSFYSLARFLVALSSLSLATYAFRPYITIPSSFPLAFALMIYHDSLSPPFLFCLSWTESTCYVDEPCGENVTTAFRTYPLLSATPALPPTRHLSLCLPVLSRPSTVPPSQPSAPTSSPRPRLSSPERSIISQLSPRGLSPIG